MNLGQIVAKYTAQLHSVNPVLQAQGLPAFYVGFRSWNTEYTLENTPRAVWRWWPLGLSLDQLYLRHKPSGRVVNIHAIASGKPFAA